MVVIIKKNKSIIIDLKYFAIRSHAKGSKKNKRRKVKRNNSFSKNIWNISCSLSGFAEKF